MQNRRVYHFNEGNVVTGQTATGQFVAFREEAELPRGRGHSVLSAIADLNVKIEREGSIYERAEDYAPEYGPSGFDFADAAE